jgi:choline kinase
MGVQVAILAAGLGTRLGQPFPKPLTPLASGQTILRRAIGRVRDAFGSDVRIMVVVGFKLDLVMEAVPDVAFAYNELYDQTNTSKSLLKALQLSSEGGVLWMNGDVVFDDKVLHEVRSLIEADRNFICVNTDSVADEEVKYTLDGAGHVSELSKQVENGLGEAVGINFVSSVDKPALIRRLDECLADDYFERGIELTISGDGVEWEAVDISAMQCIEVDFTDDLERANAAMGAASFDAVEAAR